MKYAGSGSPIASITRRWTMKPSNATFSSTTSAGIALRQVPAVVDRRALGPDRERVAPGRSECGLLHQPSRGVLAHGHQAGPGMVEQHLQAVGRGDRRRRPSARSGRSPRRTPADAEVEAAGAAEVLLAADDCAAAGPCAPAGPRRCGRVLALSTTKTASGGEVWAASPSRQPHEQVGTVVGDDHDRDAVPLRRGVRTRSPQPSRNLRWPVKSPRHPARIASTLSRSRPRSRRVNM